MKMEHGGILLATIMIVLVRSLRGLTTGLTDGLAVTGIYAAILYGSNFLAGKIAKVDRETWYEKSGWPIERISVYCLTAALVLCLIEWLANFALRIQAVNLVGKEAGSLVVSLVATAGIYFAIGFRNPSRGAIPMLPTLGIVLFNAAIIYVFVLTSF